MPLAEFPQVAFFYLINASINSFLSSLRNMLADADMPGKLQELPYRFRYNRHTTSPSLANTVIFSMLFTKARYLSS